MYWDPTGQSYEVKGPWSLTKVLPTPDTTLMTLSLSQRLPPLTLLSSIRTTTTIDRTMEYPSYRL